MNEHDSGRVKDLLLEHGYSLCEEPEDVDVLLFNTCSVRKHAEERVFGRVESLKGLKKKRPSVIFGILGCMAEAQKDLIFRKLPHVDFLCGPADLDKVPWIIEKIRHGAGHVICIGGYKSKKIPEFSKDRILGKAAYVKIMEGCSNFCSYCIVPYVRGPERSRPSKEILDEIKLLLDKGIERITLLGQNVNSYGKNLREKIDFPGLLRKIDRMIEGDCFPPQNMAGRRPSGLAMTKIDFVTSHPKDAKCDLFKTMASLSSISKRLHLPLQSGSNRILKRMNRSYTLERYKGLVKEFRSLVKGSYLSTDFIVGFPGERDIDFKDTLKALKDIQFDAAYIFRYSPRPFTKASEFKDDVPEKEKERRHAILLEAQRKISSKKKKCL